MGIAQKIMELSGTLPSGVTLCAVSKFHPPEKIMEAYSAGQRLFAESRPQELAQKVPLLPKDIEWHFIGHLQRNKIKLVVPHVKLIHSVDSEELLREIDSYALMHSLQCNCLLEVHIAEEETKQGFSISETKTLIASLEGHPLAATKIRGLMGMATYTSDTERIRREFRQIASCFNEIKARYPEDFNILSIGMSEDYKIAIEEGSTCVRIGSLIFGERQ